MMVKQSIRAHRRFATCAFAVLGIASWANFAAGAGINLVLMRGGDASNSQATSGTGAVPAYLDQYSVTVSGGVATPSYVRQYAIPSSTLTLPGILSNSHEGRLEVSGNGQYVSFGGYKAPSFLAADGAKEVGVEFTTMSKSYNMAGWRSGFCCGNAEMVKALATIKGYYDYGMFAPIQIASVIALREHQDFPEEQSRIYEHRRDVVCRGLDRLGWTYDFG